MNSRLCRCVLTCFAVSLLGCETNEGEPVLQVDVRTDYVPGEDFDSIRVEIGRGDFRVDLEHIVDLSADYVRGRRIGNSVVSAGDTDVVARMIRDGREVARREVSVTVRGGVTAATLVITRNCAGVECPMAGGDAVLSSCYGGRCADPRCTVETPEFCPSLCSADAECPSSGCLVGRCRGDVCFSEPNDDACSSTERCRADGVCVARGADAGPVDGGAPDAGCTEEACNGADDDCDGRVDEDTGTPEVCNGVDDDCDGVADEETGTPEVCNGVDDDCDGLADEEVLVVEACNGVDDDCDMLIDETEVCGDCSAWVNEGTSYVLCPASFRWDDAVAECASRGMSFLSVDDAAENAHLVERTDATMWLGLSDREEEGTFVWENGSASNYRNWQSGEPNDEDNAEDCVTTRRDGQWNDVSCNSRYGVICESP